MYKAEYTTAADKAIVAVSSFASLIEVKASSPAALTNSFAADVDFSDLLGFPNDDGLGL